MFARALKMSSKTIALILFICFLFSCCNYSRIHQDDIVQAIDTEWLESNQFEESSFLYSLYATAHYEIINMEKDTESSYLVTASVTAPDILQGLIDYQNGLNATPSAEEMNRKIIELIDSASLKTTEQTISVFIMEDGGLHVAFSNGFLNAMSGYAYQYAMEQIESLMNGGESANA